MARPRSKTLTDAELRLMRIVWKLKSCTVNDVIERLPDDEQLAYSTVLTTMRILEEKGYLTHHKEGRAYVYEPIVQREEARKDALNYIMDRFFNNSPELLVANILEDSEISEDNLAGIRALLQQADDESEGEAPEDESR